MDIQVDALAPCRKKVSVSISPERVKAAYDEKYGELNDLVALPGFRKGHAPRALLERRFGGKLGDEVKHELVKAAMESLVDDKKVEPLSAPEIDVEGTAIAPDEAFAFEFEVTTKPEFETPTYKGLDVTLPAVAIDDEEIQAGIDQLRRRDAQLSEAENAEVQAEDILVVDWRALEGDSVEARDDGVYYPYGRGFLANFVVPELDAQLEGKQAGAVVTTEVKAAADDPREDLRGRTFQLEVTLKQIQRYVLPEVDETWLKEHDYDDADELRDDVTKRIKRAKARQREREAEELLVAQLVEGIEISLPEHFVERELESWAQRKRMSLQVEGVEEDEIARQVEADRADAEAGIQRDLQRFFLLDRIANEEDLQASEGELMRAIEEIAQAYGHPVEQVLGSFRDGDRLQQLATEIRHRKARELIRSEATLVEGEAPAAEKPASEKKAAKKKSKKKKKKKDA